MLTNRCEVRLRPRQPGGVEADEFDALRHAGLDRVLQTGGVGEQRDAVRLQGDRLVHAREPGGGAALAVDDGDAPTELLAGLLDVDAVEMRNIVLLVPGQKDDLLAGFRLRGLRGPLPRGLRAGVFGDRRLGVGDSVGERRRGRRNSGEDDGGARHQGARTDIGFHAAFLPFFCARISASTMAHRSDRVPPRLERLSSFADRMTLLREPPGDLIRRSRMRAASSPNRRTSMTTVVRTDRARRPPLERAFAGSSPT